MNVVFNIEIFETFNLKSKFKIDTWKVKPIKLVMQLE